MTTLRTASASALALILGASGALADVTAEQVWQDLRGLIESSDFSVTTGGEAREGDMLVVSDVALEQSTETGGLTAEIGDIRFTEQGDGSVAIAFPESYSATAHGMSDDEPPVATSMRLDIDQPGLEIVVSGDDASREYDVTAPEVTITGSDFTEGGEPVEMDLAVAAHDLSGLYTVTGTGTGTDRREVTSDFSAAAIEMMIEAPDEEGGRAHVEIGFEDTSSTGSATLLPETAMEDLAAALEQGFAAEGRFDFDSSRFSVAGEGPDGTFDLAGGTGAGFIEGTMSADGLAYGESAADIQVTMSGSQIPLPELAFSIAEATSEFSLPVLPADEAGDMGFVLRLVDVTVPEAVWSLFDPAGVLPRDPATLIADLDGTLALDRPLFETPAEAAAGAMAAAEQAPGELESLTLNELRLSAVGAEVSGEGALTFDASDTETYGMPKPVGTIELLLTGVNGLIDDLVKLGIIPEDQLMGARMMLGAFAQPGAGEDTMTSTIEFTPGGEILANGARIR